ncbi:MAG: 30S ribosomal protein S4 [Candidatus Parcubacteria bacterium]|nr:30S ribosomal protein S4 [Candidatus Parcubacteria bacterium]
MRTVGSHHPVASHASETKMDKKCKICRRAGEKLFLKGERCFTPKCSFGRKSYPPGKRDSERKHRSTVTEYGIQLREKQKVRNVYGLSEKQFSNYVKRVTGREGDPSEKLYEELETRLDNTVYRLGLAKSRSEARQFVSHGHIMINGRRLTIASHQVKIGDILKIRPGSMVKIPFMGLAERPSKGAVPAWLSFDQRKAEAVVLGKPILDKGASEFKLTSVIEYYSR